MAPNMIHHLFLLRTNIFLKIAKTSRCGQITIAIVCLQPSDISHKKLANKKHGFKTSGRRAHMRQLVVSYVFRELVIQKGL